MESASFQPSPLNKKQIIVTPFQIFCYQNREQTQQMNPHLKGTTITSILAKMWRSLDQAQKQHFEDMSFALRGNTKICPVMTIPNKPPPPPPVTLPIIQVDNLVIPKLTIIPHRLFGVKAAEASEFALKQLQKQ